MALIRVSDYVQINAERAPTKELSVVALTSPVSRREWRAHHGVQDIRNTHEDPESFYVQTRPQDSETFFRIQEWMTGIQNELDKSWATLGEVYGRFAQLSQLGLTIRRVRSNLQDLAATPNDIDFVPLRARFKAADADLLKLLVQPLYGDSPAIGLRELIQNAVDAVRELDELLLQRNQVRADIDLPKLEAEVVASVESSDGKYSVFVRDSGIGMTPEVITEYFLTAGASFRRSDEWRKCFESSDGQSKVLRAGRFGIGVLAAFLLGDVVEVTTRHIDAEHGIQFSASIETDLVELTKCSCPVGTTIRVFISRETADGLSRNWAKWENNHDKYDTDWYCNAYPSVKRFANGRELRNKYAFSTINNEMHGWRRVDHEDFNGIFWTYSDAPNLICNGIVIPRGGVYLGRKWFVESANLYILDNNGKLPLTLDRSDLTDYKVSFEDELGRDIARDLCARVLTNCPEQLSSIADGRRKIKDFRVPQFNRLNTPWFFTTNELGLQHPSLLWDLKINSILSISIHKFPKDSPVLSAPLVPKVAYDIAFNDQTLAACDRWVRDVVDLDRFNQTDEEPAGNNVLEYYPRFGTRLLLPSKLRERYDDGKIPRTLWNLRTIEWSKNGWELVAVGNCQAPTFAFAEFAAERRPMHRTDAIGETYLHPTLEKRPQSPLIAEWLDVFRRGGVPLNPALRRRDLKDAYVRLGEYLSFLAAESK